MSAIEVIKELAEVANIYIWSTGGKDYCLRVVRSLGLEDYICGCMAKPVLCIDDSPIQEWLQCGLAQLDWRRIKEWGIELRQRGYREDGIRTTLGAPSESTPTLPQVQERPATKS